MRTLALISSFFIVACSHTPTANQRAHGYTAASFNTDYSLGTSGVLNTSGIPGMNLSGMQTNNMQHHMKVRTPGPIAMVNDKPED